jgi:hypothetical protein
MLLLCHVMCSYTSRGAAAQFEGVLQAWELAAATVLQREGLLEQLMQLRTAMQQLKQQQPNDGTCSSSNMQHVPSSSPDKAGSSTSSSSNTTTSPAVVEDSWGLTELDVRQVQQLLWAFLVSTQQVALAAEMLKKVAGQQELLVGGGVYPPAGALVEARQLQPLMDEAWQLTGCAVAAAQPAAAN